MFLTIPPFSIVWPEFFSIPDHVVESFTDWTFHLRLPAHKLKIVNELRLVKAATLFLALFVATYHHTVLQSLDMNVHLILT
jgi:hypothetical protein